MRIAVGEAESAGGRAEFDDDPYADEPGVVVFCMPGPHEVVLSMAGFRREGDEEICDWPDLAPGEHAWVR